MTDDDRYRDLAPDCPRSWDRARVLVDGAEHVARMRDREAGERLAEQAEDDADSWLRCADCGGVIRGGQCRGETHPYRPGRSPAERGQAMARRRVALGLGTAEIGAYVVDGRPVGRLLVQLVERGRVQPERLEHAIGLVDTALCWALRDRLPALGWPERLDGWDGPILVWARNTLRVDAAAREAA